MGPRFILSTAHTREDVRMTIEKFNETIRELKSEGLLKACSSARATFLFHPQHKPQENAAYAREGSGIR